MWVYNFMDDAPLILIKACMQVKLWRFDQFGNEFSCDVLYLQSWNEVHIHNGVFSLWFLLAIFFLLDLFYKLSGRLETTCWLISYLLFKIWAKSLSEGEPEKLFSSGAGVPGNRLSLEDLSLIIKFPSWIELGFKSPFSGPEFRSIYDYILLKTLRKIPANRLISIFTHITISIVSYEAINNLKNMLRTLSIATLKGLLLTLLIQAVAP